MMWPFRNKVESSYWLRVFAYYALAELGVQLVFFFIFNTYTGSEGSNIEYHLLMVVFHCILIWPIWWVARSVRKQPVFVQVFVNLVFAFIYGYAWLVPVQDAFAWVYNHVLDITQPGSRHEDPTIDSKLHFSILNYQILKHAFRLCWYYMAAYLYNYQREEKQRIELAVSNKELQLKLLKWHLNPSFYFRTIKYLQQSAAEQPLNASGSVLQLARVMEYVIYEASQPQVDMRKEMDFLSSYVQLANQQTGKDNFIMLDYEAGDAELKIAPLLLAGLIDNITSVAETTGLASCWVHVRLGGNELILEAAGLQQCPAKPALLDELYNGRYAIQYSTEKGYRLSLQLDAV